MGLLNADIVDHILDSYDCWWPRDLCRLARVSRVWLQPVRKRLYADPILYTYGACHLLTRALEENPAIIAFIHSLDLRPEHDWTFGDDAHGYNPYARTPIRRLLALTHLKRITLGGDLASNADRYLRTVGNPQVVKALVIIGPGNKSQQICSPPPNEALFWDGELLTRFYALESLTFRENLTLEVDDMHYDDQYVDLEDNAMRRGCMLKELVLKGVYFANDSGPLCSLLHGPALWRGLRIFDFTVRGCTQRDIKNLVSILELAHDSLEELAFLDYLPQSPEIFHDLLDLLSGVPPLRSLRRLKTTTPLAHDGFQPITANVELLEIAGSFWVQGLLQWALYFDSTAEQQIPALPNLRKLVVRLDDSSNSGYLPLLQDASVKLVDACRNRGIELEYDGSLRFSSICSYVNSQRMDSLQPPY